MGTRLAKTCVLRAQKTLQDETGVQWTQGELLDGLNDVQLEIVKARPRAHTKVANFTCVAGAKQTAPSDCLKILNPICNMGATGTTRGKIVEWADMDTLNRTDRDWMTATAVTSIYHILQPENERDTYYTYPPVSGTIYIEMNYSAVPADCTINGVNGGGSDSVITLKDIYFDSLYYGILFRAHSKESDNANAELASKYRALFERSLELDGMGDTQVEESRAGTIG